MSTEEGAPASRETQATTPGEPRTFASGRYVVQRLLGEGAQKTVFLVHDTELDRDCALSLIRTDLLDPEDLARLRREAQTMARLTHANIVTVHDIGDDGARPYVVSEFVAGGDLQDKLRNTGGPLPLAEAVAIGEDLCKALATAHRRGVIHRDIKPGNIWLAEDGSSKLGDFGIAQAADRSRLTMTGTVMGTAAYMAPEQAQGREITARCDLYSLGCVLYEMVTGRPPFVGDDPMKVVSQHVHAQPTPPSQHNAEVPSDLERLILRLLAKAPEGRPASADEVLEELERIETALPALPTRAVHLPSRRLASLWARPAVRVAAAALLLAVVGGGAAGGVTLSRGGGGGGGGGLPPADPFQEVTVQLSTETEGHIVGDCVDEDLLIITTAIEGDVIGDLSGSVTGTSETTLYASEGCRSGVVTASLTLTDREGNSLSWEHEGPSSVATTAGGESAGTSIIAAGTITGGTGIYEGATGLTTCNVLGAVQIQPDGSFTGGAQADCQFELATAGAAATALEPLIVQVGASPPEVAVFGRSVNLPSTVIIRVVYRNTRDDVQRGLSLTLPVPDGAEILAAARGEEQPVSSGERVWSLPNLPPGEIQRFEFTLQFLAAEQPAVPLVVEIDGEGFAEPVRSELVSIEIVQ